MKIEKTELDGVLIITPDVFPDNRGYFFESYNLQKYVNIPRFVQDNESKSVKGVLRGMHYQMPPFAQGKLIRIILGKVLDVIVDIRYDSPTFGKHFKIELSGENKKQLYIPPGFAHGFATLSEEVIFEYKCTNFYNKESKRGIMLNHKDLNIDWGDINNITISDQDKLNKSFKELTEELKLIKSQDWNKILE